MAEEYSENSGLTYNLGVCIDDPEDIAAFDEQMRNVVITPLMKDMIDDLIRLQRMGNL